jgi:hypothetical protein
MQEVDFCVKGVIGAILFFIFFHKPLSFTFCYDISIVIFNSSGGVSWCW